MYYRSDYYTSQIESFLHKMQFNFHLIVSLQCQFCPCFRINQCWIEHWCMYFVVTVSNTGNNTVMLTSWWRPRKPLWYHNSSAPWPPSTRWTAPRDWRTICVRSSGVLKRRHWWIEVPPLGTGWRDGGVDLRTRKSSSLTSSWETEPGRRLSNWSRRRTIVDGPGKTKNERQSIGNVQMKDGCGGDSSTQTALPATKTIPAGCADAGPARTKFGSAGWARDPSGGRWEAPRARTRCRWPHRPPRRTLCLAWKLKKLGWRGWSVSYAKADKRPDSDPLLPRVTDSCCSCTTEMLAIKTANATLYNKLLTYSNSGWNIATSCTPTKTHWKWRNPIVH